MKKLFIVLLVVAVATSSVFAISGTSLGFSQGLVNTSFVASYDWENFGVQGDVGLPLIYSTVGAIGAIAEKASGESEKETNILDFILPGAHVGAYWRAIKGEHFGWNLGLGGSFQSYFVENKIRIWGFASITSGLQYRFNDKFAIGLDTSVPIALPLSLISEDAAKCTCFYFVDGESKPADIAVILFGAIYYGINELARVNFKWSL